MPKERLAIFADVQNIYYTTRQRYQKHFNYGALWQQVVADKELVAAIAYATDRGDVKQKGFQQILSNIGFTIKLKPYLQRRDGTAKGDWDVGIALDVLDYAPKLDKLVLLSGDGDFDLLLLKIRQKYGVTSLVYGVEGLTSPALIRAADEFIPISGKLLL